MCSFSALATNIVYIYYEYTICTSSLDDIFSRFVPEILQAQDSIVILILPVPWIQRPEVIEVVLELILGQILFVVRRLRDTAARKAAVELNSPCQRGRI